MAEGKKSFILYADLIHTVSKMPNEKAGELFKHILMYVNDEKPINTDLLIQLTFEPIKQQFKRDLVKWEGTKEGRSKAGKASAEAKKIIKEIQQTSTNLTNVDFVQQIQQTSTNVNKVQQVSTNSTVNVNVNVNVNDIFYKELIISESWLEINAKNNKSTPDKVLKYLDKFNNNLIAQGDKKVNKKEYMSHFARWLPLELAKDIKDKPKFIPMI